LGPKPYALHPNSDPNPHTTDRPGHSGRGWSRCIMVGPLESRSRGVHRPCTEVDRVSIRSYRDLIVWREAMDLAVACHRLVDGFPRVEKYGLALQVRRAAVSVPANIAEGRSRFGTREFARFLSIARGSLAE